MSVDLQSILDEYQLEPDILAEIQADRETLGRLLEVAQRTEEGDIEELMTAIENAAKSTKYMSPVRNETVVTLRGEINEDYQDNAKHVNNLMLELMGVCARYGIVIDPFRGPFLSFEERA